MRKRSFEDAGISSKVAKVDEDHTVINPKANKVLDALARQTAHYETTGINKVRDELEELGGRLSELMATTESNGGLAKGAAKAHPKFGKGVAGINGQLDSLIGKINDLLIEMDGVDD